MKPRTLHTIKLLAVAAAGCTRTVGPEAGAEPVASPPVAVEIPKPAAAPEVVAPARPIPPLPAGAQGVALVALRGELAAVGADKASRQTRHFRPLCDKDGYPLVGNVTPGKGNPLDDKTYGPDAFCAEVRMQAKR